MDGNGQRLSQEVIFGPVGPPAPEPPTPAVPGPGPAPPSPLEKRWDGILRLLDEARRHEVFEVPEALDDLTDKYLLAQREGRPLPGTAPVKREIARVREQLVWGLRQAGYTQWAIAQEVGMSQPGVLKVLRRVERRVLAKLESEVRTIKATQHYRLEFLLDQALQAWRESQKVQSRTVLKPGGSTYETSPCAGDPRFLKVALEVLAAERELWGLSAPVAPGEESLTMQRTETLAIRRPATRR